MSKFLVISIVLFAISACGFHRQNSPTIPDATKTSISSITPIVGITKEPEKLFTETLAPFITPSTPTASSTPRITETMENVCGTFANGHSVFIDDYPSIKIRQGPGCEYKEKEGNEIKTNPISFLNVLGKHGDWLLIDLCDNNQGWVFAPAIARINFDVTMDDLPEIIPPPPSTVLQATLPLIESADAIDQANKTLVEFFDHLYEKNYAEAVKVFAGGYGVAINWNSDVDPYDYPTLLMRACEWNGFHCFLRIGKTIKGEQISPMEFHFIVEFINEDGSLYNRRGPDDAEISQFGFRVVRDCDGNYYAVDWPFYEQYGN